VKVDIIFPARGRNEFTRLSLKALMANTNWELVEELRLFGDITGQAWEQASTVQHLSDIVCLRGPRRRSLSLDAYGSPVAIMNAVLSKAGAEVFAKIDNDTMVPPGWLDRCVEVMTKHSQLDFLGIEPPRSRTPAPWAPDAHVPKPELNAIYSAAGFAPCDAIGGIGLMRRSAFERHYKPMVPFATYGGFTDWQIANIGSLKGWIAPPLDVFLLDRLPIARFVELSEYYQQLGLQRPWTKYDPADHELWDWALPLFQH
jgi:hypothetical protein